jgi:hypothetical protein
MDLISFLGDADGLAPQLLPFESIGFVDVEGAFEPGDGGLTNIADRKISMRRVEAQLGSFERPLRDASKAMSRAGVALRARAEPRKDNRYSAADRLSRRKRALGAEEKDGPLPAAPTSHMSAV